MSYQINRTGNIFIDLGLLRFYELLGESNSKIERNYLQIDKVENDVICKKILNKLKQENEVDSKIKQLQDKISNENNKEKKEQLLSNLKKQKNQNYASIVKKFLNNNTMFGQPNSITDECFKKNLEVLISKVQKTLGNNINGENCNFCFNFKTEDKIEYYKKGKNGVIKDETDREITNTRYPLMGAKSGGEGLTSFFPQGKSIVKMCYVCEFLTFLNSYKTPNYVLYVPDLQIMSRLEKRLDFRQNLSMDIYNELVRFGFSGIKVFEFIYKNGVSIKNFGVYSPDSLQKYLKLKNIISNFSFNTIKPQIIKDQIYVYAINLNYNLVKKILLSHIFIPQNEYKSYTNIGLFNKFQKEVLENMSKCNLKELKREFKSSAEEIRNKMETKKIQSYCLKLLSLLKSENREELFNIITHLCVSYGVKLPTQVSEVILKGTENDMTYAVGIFIENLYKGGE